MKTLALLAACILAAPGATFADPSHGSGSHWGGGGSHWGGDGARWHGGGGGFSYGGGYYPYGGYPYGYYGPPPISFSYYSEPRVYQGRPYYGAYESPVAIDVQRALRRLGYYRGPLDGDIGPGSHAAIRAYQRDSGLEVTGRIDRSLLRSLAI